MNNSTMECVFRNKAILLYTSFYYCTDSKSYYYNNSPTDDIIRRYLEASRAGRRLGLVPEYL